MHILAALSMKNRALIALVTIVAAIFGGLALTSLKQELIPSVELPQIAIVSQYRGAAPEVVSSDVSTPVESAIQGITGLESTSSTSSTGLSIVTATFSFGTDLTFAQNKLQIAVNRIQNVLPDGVTPTVLAFATSDIPVMAIAITGVEDTSKLSDDVSRTTLGEIRDIEGVRDATLVGDVGRRIAIVPDAEKLAELGLSNSAISNALSQNGILLPAGQIDQDGKTYAVQIGERLSSTADITELPLTGATETRVVQSSPFAPPTVTRTPVTATIGEVATVEIVDNPITSISRVNGEPALTISITKLPAANTVEVSAAITAALADLEASLQSANPGATFTVVFDQAPFIERSIDDLVQEGLLGLLFAVLVILVFLLSVRATIVTAISIPTSVLITFIGLQAADYTLNILTLGALTIAIGRVVDDSIVVIENIKRHLVEGVDKASTIVRATREVAGAITAATITTVAVFLPLALVEGITGELFRPFALTVTISLLASLFVSLTIVPVLAYWFLLPTPRDSVDAVTSETGTEDLEHPNRLQRAYLPMLRLTLKRGAATLIVAVLVLGGTVALVPLLKTNFLGDSGQNTFNVRQELPVGTSLSALDEASREVEQTILDTEGVEIVQTSVGGGGQGPAGALSDNSNRITYAVTTDPTADQVELQRQVREELEALGPEVGEISFGGGGTGFGGNSIDIQVQAANDADLRAATDAVVASVSEVDGLAEVTSNLSDTRDYVDVRIDRAAAAEVGLSEVALGSLVAGQTQPSSIGEVVIEENRLRVYLTPSELPTSVEEISAIEVPTQQGVKRLDELATVEVKPGPTSITTIKSQRTAEVSVVPDSDNVGAVSQAVTLAVTEAELPQGTSAEIGGVASDQAEAFSQLGLALLAAILIVYIVMVATFKSLLQPLLLLVSVPFAATGAIALQVISGVPLGVPSLIGVLMLVGIVVTNAIVLIDLVNQYRERGIALYDAVVLGASRRLRPIIMTALATIFALLPLALAIGKGGGGGGFISQPLALVVIGGLFSSTLLTLIVLPTLYYVVERRREKTSAKREAKRQARADKQRDRMRAKREAREAKAATKANAKSQAVRGRRVARPDADASSSGAAAEPAG